MTMAKQKSVSKSETAVKTAMANVFFLAKEDLPNSMAQQMNSFLLYQDQRDEQGHVNNVHTHRHYNSISPQSVTTSFSESREWDPDGFAMSRGRRTFCLLTTFDLILTFILWVINTQLIGVRPVWKAFNDQVGNYDFETSLFDTVMIATARFTFIMLAYALFRIRHWWVIAITTSMTCIYLLFKCFLFDFNDSFLQGKNPMSYVVLIICFIMAWLEMWFLDFKVIPSENQVLRAHRARYRDVEREPLMNSNSNSNSTEDTREYYSPFHTPEGSEDEGEASTSHGHHGHHKHSHAHKQKHHRQASDVSNISMFSVQSELDTENYNQLLADARIDFMNLFEMDGWKHEGGKDLQEGLIYSQNVKKFGRKIFKLQGMINMAPGDLWEDMVHTLNDSPKWNPTILESRTLIVVDENTEIMYNISAESAGGLVSARDFISIRRWLKISDELFVVISTCCTVADMPAQKKYVRGENGPGGWIFEPVKDEPNKCLFTWIVNTNLKGWLPQTAIDQAMSYVLSSYFKLLVKHYEEIISQRHQNL